MLIFKFKYKVTIPLYLHNYLLKSGAILNTRHVYQGANDDGLSSVRRAK